MELKSLSCRAALCCSTQWGVKKLCSAPRTARSEVAAKVRKNQQTLNRVLRISNAMETSLFALYTTPAQNARAPRAIKQVGPATSDDRAEKSPGKRAVGSSNIFIQADLRALSAISPKALTEFHIPRAKPSRMRKIKMTVASGHFDFPHFGQAGFRCCCGWGGEGVVCSAHSSAEQFAHRTASSLLFHLHFGHSVNSQALLPPGIIAFLDLHHEAENVPSILSCGRLLIHPHRHYITSRYPTTLSISPATAPAAAAARKNSGSSSNERPMLDILKPFS